MPDSHPEFEPLLVRAEHGSSEALGAVLERLRGALTRAAGRNLAPWLRGKVAPSDVVQEALLEATRSFGRFRGRTRAELKAWVLCIVRRRAARHARLHAGTREGDPGRDVPLAAGSSSCRLGALASPGESPSAELIAWEDAGRVRAMVAALPHDYRRVLRLRYEEGWSFPDIAAHLGRSANAVTLLWFRAIGRLRTLLAEGEP